MHDVALTFQPAGRLDYRLAPLSLRLLSLSSFPRSSAQAEFCSHGSLYDVLRQALADPQFAAQLTWQCRLQMVRGVYGACTGSGASTQIGGCCCVGADRYRQLYNKSNRRFMSCLTPNSCSMTLPLLCKAYDGARGLLYLHSRGILHRDVKSPNMVRAVH